MRIGILILFCLPFLARGAEENVHACIYSLEVVMDQMESYGSKNWIQWSQQFEDQWLKVVEELPEQGFWLKMWDRARLFFVQGICALDGGQKQAASSYLTKSARELRALAKVYRKKGSKAQKRSGYLAFELKIEPYWREKLRPHLLDESQGVKILLDSLYLLQTNPDLDFAEKKKGMEFFTHFAIPGAQLGIPKNNKELAARALAFKQIRCCINERKLKHFSAPVASIYPRPESGEPILVMHLPPLKQRNRLEKEDIPELFTLMQQCRLSRFSLSDLGWSRQRKWMFKDAFSCGEVPAFAEVRKSLPNKWKRLWDRFVLQAAAIKSNPPFRKI